MNHVNLFKGLELPRVKSSIF